MSERLSPKANVAFVLRGDLSRLSSLCDEIAVLIERRGGFVEVVFQTMSASKLFIIEDRDVKKDREDP